jgi:hypothetical protein
MKSRVWREGIIGWIIILAIFATGTPAASQSCVSPPEGLVSWWAAEGDAIDSLGPNHGMVWNGANFTDGVTGRAFSFDGIDDYVEVPDAASLNLTSALTIEGWINPRSLSHRYPAIVKKSGVRGGSSTSRGYSLEFNDRTPQVVLWLYIGDQWFPSPPAEVPVGTDTWSHVAATYDGTWIRMFLNGTEIGQATYRPGSIALSDNPLNIGRDPANPGDPDRYFDGLIDEVRIYNRPLTAGEIGSIYQAGSAGTCRSQSPSCVQPAADLVSWWPADGDVEDFVGMNVGALVNGATFAPGFVGQAFSLDGVNDFIEIPDAPNLNFSSAITIQAWINPRSLPTRYPAIVKKSGLSGGSSDTTGYSLEFRDGAPQVVLWVYLKDQWFSSPPATVPVGTDTWSHVAATYDGTSIRMYLNGTEIGPPTYKPGNIIPSSDNPLNIARDPANPGDPDRYFDGLIDEVMIYNRALTAGEIRTIYQAKEAGVCKNHPPAAICQNVNVPAGPTCTASASIDNGSFDPEGDAIALTQSPGGPYPLGSTLATLTVTEAKGVVRQCEGTITVVDTTPPSLVSPASLTLSPEPGTCGVSISDAQLGQATVGDNCPGGMTITRAGVPANHLFPVGTTTITYTVTDAAGNTATATQTVTVIDSTTREITDLSVSPEVLWPANGKMVEVWLGYNLKTDCSAGPMTCQLGVSSNETIDSSDYSILDAHHLLLRAKRDPKGDGRTYTITVICSDGRGPELNKSITVLVPDKNDKGGKKN